MTYHLSQFNKNNWKKELTQSIEWLTFHSFS